MMKNQSSEQISSSFNQRSTGISQLKVNFGQQHSLSRSLLMRNVNTPDRGKRMHGFFQFSVLPDTKEIPAARAFVPFDGAKVYSLERTKRRGTHGDRDVFENHQNAIQNSNHKRKELLNASLFEGNSMNENTKTEEKERVENDMLHLSSRPRTRDVQMRKQRMQADALDQQVRRKGNVVREIEQLLFCAQIEERRLLKESLCSKDIRNESGSNNKIRNNSPISFAKELLLDSSFFYSSPVNEIRNMNRNNIPGKDRYNNNHTNRAAQALQQISPGTLTLEERIARQAEIYHSLHNPLLVGGINQRNSNEFNGNVRLPSHSEFRDAGEDEGKIKKDREMRLRQLIQYRQMKAVGNVQEISQERVKKQNYAKKDEVGFDQRHSVFEGNENDKGSQLAEEGIRRVKQVQRQRDGQRESLNRKEKDRYQHLKREDKKGKEVGQSWSRNERNEEKSENVKYSENLAEKMDGQQVQDEETTLKTLAYRRLHTNEERLTPLRDQKFKKYSEELQLFPVISKSPQQESAQNSTEKRTSQLRQSPSIILELESEAFKKLKDDRPSLISSILPFTPTKREPEMMTMSKGQALQGVFNSVAKEMTAVKENVERVGLDVLKQDMMSRNALREEVKLYAMNTVKKIQEEGKYKGKKKQSNEQRRIEKKEGNNMAVGVKNQEKERDNHQISEEQENHNRHLKDMMDDSLCLNSNTQNKEGSEVSQLGRESKGQKALGNKELSNNSSIQIFNEHQISREHHNGEANN